MLVIAIIVTAAVAILGFNVLWWLYFGPTRRF